GGEAAECSRPVTDALPRASFPPLPGPPSIGPIRPCQSRKSRRPYHDPRHRRHRNQRAGDRAGVAGLGPPAAGAGPRPPEGGRTPFVDVRDIAAVAARVLAEDGHEGKAYDVTGPAALGYADVAATFARVLGRPVAYVDVPAAAAKQGMVGGGMPEWVADAVNE